MWQTRREETTTIDATVSAVATGGCSYAPHRRTWKTKKKTKRREKKNGDKTDSDGRSTVRVRSRTDWLIRSIRETWNHFQNWAADRGGNPQTQYGYSTHTVRIPRGSRRIEHSPRSAASVRKCERGVTVCAQSGRRLHGHMRVVEHATVELLGQWFSGLSNGTPRWDSVSSGRRRESCFGRRIAGARPTPHSPLNLGQGYWASTATVWWNLVYCETKTPRCHQLGELEHCKWSLLLRNESPAEGADRARRHGNKRHQFLHRAQWTSVR